MATALVLIPLLPMLSAALLMIFGRRLPQQLVAIIGAGAVALSALCVLSIAQPFLATHQALQVQLWSWMQIGDFSPNFSFYVDGLTLVMMSIITGVGFLIHLYSTEFMQQDDSFSRYFAYLNLFIAAMLILVMADNLLLLYLGWEGVGLCSYLLVGFWYRDPANGAAARKAFIVTRVGDTAMALGLLLLYTELGTLEIQPLMTAANIHWVEGDGLAIVATALLLGGALGKSAQIPLHTWLPDAMAGPTPVSALIHAATMVTAGVYLIARTHELFLLAPPTLIAVALIGLLTALMAAFSALVQQDIKRILAYSTISQIGYMFLGLGVGAWGASVFHLMTHAFFKALLFLAAGAVIHCLHHEHNIFRMGGLRTRLPVVFWSFLIGAAALAALPLTSGFFSKDAILLAAWQAPGIGPLLWLGGLLGALLTAFYSFRLVFIVFFGELQTSPDKQPGWRMALPLALLCLLSLAGGWIGIPVREVFPPQEEQHAGFLVHVISIGIPLLGVWLAYAVYISKQISFQDAAASPRGRRWSQLWLAGWRFDDFYSWLLVRPYQTIARFLRNEPVDRFYDFIAAISLQFNHLLSNLQNGRLRWYATSMIMGLILMLILGMEGAT